MRVLLSVKPEYARHIFDGTKKYEYRKTIFKRKDIDGVIIYVSSPVSLVIGEFEVGEIIHEDIETLWRKTKTEAGISKEKFFKYFANKSRGYAIEIETIKRYNSPQKLHHLMISTPPQSFCYVNRPRNLTNSFI
jgi:predicted transcriptional regulator